MIARLNITGLNELRESLIAKAKMDMAKTVVAHHTTQMREEALRLVPVDTGFLKRSIIATSRDNGLTGVVGTNTEYAGYVEYGTRFQRAQPYMWPAFNKVKWDFIKDMMRIAKA